MTPVRRRAMAKILSFFPRQAVLGGTSITSEVFDVSDIAQLIVDLRVYSFGGGYGVSAFLYDSPSPNPDNWRTKDQIGVGGVGLSTITTSQLYRFVRARLGFTGNSGSIVSVEGIGREST
jgi:hypothetical protein